MAESAAKRLTVRAAMELSLGVEYWRVGAAEHPASVRRFACYGRVVHTNGDDE